MRQGRGKLPITDTRPMGDFLLRALSLLDVFARQRARVQAVPGVETTFP
jgi:hypothetical protein